MNRLTWLILAVLISSAALGCARAKIINDPGATYESMGFLEEKISIRGPLYKKSYPKLVKKINKILAKEARHKYGADAVNNIKYWPSPDSDAVVDYFYGRGEMIRFKKFDETATVSSTDIAR